MKIELYTTFELSHERNVQNVVSPTPVVQQLLGQQVLPMPKPIVMVTPYNRAKQAVESCTSQEALETVGGQINRSEKLIPSEKGPLLNLVVEKEYSLMKQSIENATTQKELDSIKTYITNSEKFTQNKKDVLLVMVNDKDFKLA